MFDNERYNDKARFSIGDNSCGSYKQKGEVKFFCEDTTNSKDGRTIQGIGNLKNRGWRSGQSFGPGGCSTTAGDLLSWDVSWNGLETFFNDARYIVEGPSFREFKTNWFCCSNCKGQFIYASGSPEKNDN